MTENKAEFALFGNKRVELIYNRKFFDVLDQIESRIIIITDENVYSLYKQCLHQKDTIITGTGEEIKTISTIEEIYNRLLHMEADRHCMLIGLGGGIVCDIAGFVASTFNRGLKLGLVPTTLLAQVDAGIGGKNGVNVDRFKNMAGTFYQPDFIIFDSGFFRTLPVKELLCGISESVKHSLIRSRELFEFLSQNSEKIMRMDEKSLKRLVRLSSRVKIDIVEKDEKETDLRRLLNFGHTFGHAIERELNISHGEAVNIGMLISLRMSKKLNYLNSSALSSILSLFEKLNLATEYAIDNMHVIHSVRKDKKRHSDSISFVFLRDIGDAFIKSITLEELSEMYKSI